MIKYILLISLCSITTSCVSSNFENYQSIDNLKKNKDYYEIKEKDGKINYIKVGLNTIQNIQNSYFIYIVLKSKTSTTTNIRSTTFGKIDTPPNEKIYLKKIVGKPIADTVYINFPNKVYTFYYKENL